MVSVLLGTNAGGKNGQPEMWSQWVWRSMLCATTGCSAIKVSLGSRLPVPASMMNSSPSRVRTSTQEQLPPYRTVLGPGDGIEPRVPQNRIFMSPSTSASPGCRRILLYTALPARCQNPRNALVDTISIQWRRRGTTGHPTRFDIPSPVPITSCQLSQDARQLARQFRGDEGRDSLSLDK